MEQQENQQHELLKDGDIYAGENGLIFNPFNPENQEITLNDVQSILKRFGIDTKINNFELYKRAFIIALIQNVLP